MDDRERAWSIMAVELDGKEVRLDDFSFGFWDRIAKQLAKLESVGYGTLLAAPMTFPEMAYDMAVEAARLLGNANPAGKIDELCAGAYGEVSLKKLGDLFVIAEDDLPTETERAEGSDVAVPPQGDETSTPGS